METLGYQFKFYQEQVNTTIDGFQDEPIGCTSTSSGMLKAPKIRKKTKVPIRGVTVCEVWKDTFMVSKGAAYCSAKDKWDEKKGRREAFKRTMANEGRLYGFSKAERAAFWKVFLNTEK